MVGCRWPRILFRHILPNLTSPLLTLGIMIGGVDEQEEGEDFKTQQVGHDRGDQIGAALQAKLLLAAGA